MIQALSEMKTVPAFWLVFFVCANLRAAAPLSPDDAWYDRVEPLLDHYCFKCHGGVRQKGGLDLRSVENILKGGEHGSSIIPGDPSSSRLVQNVLTGADPHMPLDERKQLGDKDVAILRSWIASFPKPGLAKSALPGQPGWPEQYLKALQASQKPLWTPPPAMEPHKVIDRFIQLGWKKRGVEHAPLCDDRAFVRRVYLDLSGRIPSILETEAFLQNPVPDKRTRLVDALLDSPEYPRRMREVFDVVLLGRGKENAGQERREHHWFEFLETAFRRNYGWDRIVRDLILARPSAPEDKGADWFLYSRKDKYQKMAEAVAPIAFGFQIGCAQCHNHPLSAEVGQKHYWGLVAAFNRSKNIETSRGPSVSESAVGGFINFSNLKKESQPATLDFLSGRAVAEKRPADGEKETDSPDLYLVPPPKEKEKTALPATPKFSRREALADAATRDNPRLATAIVNRVWDMLMGRGLVVPVDDLASRHRPSHPELLAWMAHDFEKHGYDVKRLIREIVLTSAYQLDSLPRGSQPPAPEAFAFGLEKPLSGEQIYRSLLVATGNQPGPDGKIGGREENEVRGAFVTRFPDLFPDNYSPSLQQAMFVSNSPILEDLLKGRPGNTPDKLSRLPSPEARIGLAFQSVLGRNPDRKELGECAEFLRRENISTGPANLLWALFASPEFQVNH